MGNIHFKECVKLYFSIAKPVFSSSDRAIVQINQGGALFQTCPTSPNLRQIYLTYLLNQTFAGL